MNTRSLAYLLAIVGVGGMLFNAVQVIIIIAGDYNRNPAIESPLLATLDAIGLTAVWFVVSLIAFVVSFRYLRSA